MYYVIYSKIICEGFNGAVEARLEIARGNLCYSDFDK